MNMSSRPLILCALGLAGLAACGRGDAPSTGVVRVLSPAEAACRTAVAEEAGVSAVAVASAVPAAGGTRVTLSAPGGATWTCQADSAGNVASITPPSA